MNQIGRASDISSRHAHRVAPPSAPSILVAGIFERVVLPQREAVEGVQLGVEDHDRVGERFLAAAGFPESVTKFVRGHVLAKRYLVFK